MFANLPEMLSAKDLMEILPVSCSGVYALLRDPTFPTIRLGRRVIVPRDAFCAWLQKNMTGDVELPAASAARDLPVVQEPAAPVAQEAQVSAATVPDNAESIARKNAALFAALAALANNHAVS